MSGATATPSACWLCEGPARSDPRLAAAGYVRCATCGFVFQPARDSPEDEARLYDADYFATYDSRTGARRAEGHYDLAADQRRSEAVLRAEHVRRYARPPARLLEVGAASGWFVSAAAEAGYTAQGVEPSAAQARAAGDRGLAVRHGTLADLASGPETFDVVCAWHVLEHLPRPRDAVAQMRALLRPGGLLFLEVPNIGSIAATRRGTTWAHLDPGAHVAHYDPSTVRRLLEASGFDVVALDTFSPRQFSRTPTRRLLHAAHDAVLHGTPALTHAWRHQLLRVVAVRRPVVP